MIRKLGFALAFCLALLAPAKADQTTLTTPGAPLTMTQLATFLNNALGTVGSNFSGTSAPAVYSGATIKTYQFWVDTSGGASAINYKTYDGAQWVSIGNLNTSTHVWSLNLASFPTMATNTVLGNATSGTAVPTALAVNSCSGANNALIWTTNTGFGCNTIASGITIGTTAITSGTTLRLLYDLAGVVSETAHWTYTAASGLLQGDGTSAVAIGGATIGSNALAVTGTASISGVLGLATTGGGTTANLVWGTDTTGWGRSGANQWTFTNGSYSIIRALNGALEFSSDMILAWNNTTSATATRDLILQRDAANTLAQRNGTNAQKLSVYNTFTDASNYERGVVDYITNANVLTIGHQAAGTGTASRGIRFFTSSTAFFSINETTSNWNIVSTSDLIPGTNNAFSIGSASKTVQNLHTSALTLYGNTTWPTDNAYDIGASGATRPRNIYVAGNGTFGGPIRISAGYTVATLPTAGTAGRYAYVTDQLTTCAAAGAALTGGGSVVCPVFDNGSAWVGGWIFFLCGAGVRRRKKPANDNETQERIAA